MLEIPKIDTNQKKSVYIGLGILLTVSLSISGFFLYRFNTRNNNLNGGQQVSEKEMQELIKQVGKIYELPKGETPEIATVTDVNRLRNQPFFANAQVGDKVLVYINARKGVLYRPSTNQIINISPININNQATAQNQAKSSKESTQSLRVALYNGTQKSGLASQFEQSLKQKVTSVQFDVVEKNNAKRNDYKLTQVIDLKGNLNEQVIQLASALDAENAKLSEDESAPRVDADVLIIIGSDYSNTPTSSN